MTTMGSSIYTSGRVYDLLYPPSEAGQRYWQALAQTYPGPILELTCGTGHVAIPLAQMGSEVVGLDQAEGMLAEARRKAQAAGVTVEWRLGDMRSFDLGRTFGLILLPSNAIWHLLTREDLEACLACTARHLQPDGRFAVSVFVPNLDLLRKPPDEQQPFGEYDDPVLGKTVTMTHTSWYDPATQIKYNQLYRRVGNGPLERDGDLMLRMYFPRELDALFWYNGFAIDHKYGDPDRRPFDVYATHQLYVLKQR